MEISPRQLKKFKKIYRAQFGEDLPDEQAKETSDRLLTIIQIVAEHPYEVRN